MTFIFDNDISFRLALALQHLVENHRIVALRDEFKQDTPDIDWIPEVGRRKWVLISCDYNQRRRTKEHQALRDYHVRAVYIRHGRNPRSLFDDAARIIKNWPKIEEWAQNAPEGELVRLDAKDKIEKL